MNKLDAMRHAGDINRVTIEYAFEVAAHGISKKDLDWLVGEFIKSRDATPAFLGYNGFPGN